MHGPINPEIIRDEAKNRSWTKWLIGTCAVLVAGKIGYDVGQENNPDQIVNVAFATSVVAGAVAMWPRRGEMV